VTRARVHLKMGCLIEASLYIINLRDLTGNKRVGIVLYISRLLAVYIVASLGIGCFYMRG